MSACSSGSDEPHGELRIAAGEQDSAYYLYGNALAGLVRQAWPEVHPKMIITRTSQENLQKVRVGEADVAFTQADVAALTGATDTLVALARLYDDYVHLVTLQRSSIRRVADLKDRPVSIGLAGSGTEITANRVLTLGGLSPLTDVRALRLGLEDSITALRQGTIDAFFYSGGLPVDAITVLSRDIPITLVDLSAYVAPMRGLFGAYTAQVVPRSTYGTSAVTTIAVANYLVVRPNMSEEMAYGLTRMLFDGRDVLAQAHPAGARLNIRSAVGTQPLALHPGAVRFYRDRKI